MIDAIEQALKYHGLVKLSAEVSRRAGVDLGEDLLRDVARSVAVRFTKQAVDNRAIVDGIESLKALEE
jgi:hypothetical protein